MNIRNAVPDELEQLLAIYDNARAFMRQSGNPRQWAGGEPTEEEIKQDIHNGNLYVVEDAEIAGVFFFAEGEDETYRVIDGAWQNDAPYAVLHKVAVATPGRGVVGAIFDWAYAKCPNLKIDTHRDNIPMQRALAKHGFVKCGTVFLKNGQERMAFQKTS